MTDIITRRTFLRVVSATGIGVAAGGNVLAQTDKSEADTKAASKPRFPQVPRRTLGKTGLSVPILSLGAMYNVVDNQIGLRKSLVHNSNYWDTAHSYAGGNSEIGIGNYLERNPEVREKLIIATKASGAKSIADVEKRLQTSLERMHTDYIDIYYGVHALKSPSQLTDELKEWSIEAKKRGVIKHFGFTTHTNMAENLEAASKCDWIDVIMTSFNYQLMQDEKFMAAVEKCHKAGIGLVAMKVMTRGQKIEDEKGSEMAKHFLEKGMTQGQAKIKIVLEDQRVASACVGMDNIAILNENIGCVTDDKKLSSADKRFMSEYASLNCSGYCIGCRNCEKYSQMPYTPEVMRSLMYYNNYTGDYSKQLAKSVYGEIPLAYRSQIATLDYSKAQAMCPHRLPIAELMAEADRKLA